MDGPTTKTGNRRAKTLKWAGLFVLVLGVAGAGIIYWRGTQAPDLSDDPSMLQFGKAESRQMAMLYGQQGLLIQKFLDDLKQPDTQAVMLLIFSGIVAGALFIFARLPERENDEDFFKPAASTKNDQH